MPVLTSMFKAPQFRRMAKSADYSGTSPVEAIVCDDGVQSMYCQLLCSLINRSKVVSVGAPFPSTMLRVIRFLEEKWPQLLRDIREKKLTGDMVTDVALRDATEAILAASSEEDGEGQAELLAKAYESCQENGGRDLIKRLWPYAKCVEVIVTGTMAQYVSMLQFYAGGLPLVSTIYASSECFCALNLRPLSSPTSISYTFVPTMAYFEFLPISSEPSPENLVDLSNVEVGKEYELVLTTDRGLYRYRIGDVLRVTGFHNSSPEFQILGRKDALISIDAEKTDEETLLRAVQTAISKKLDGTGFRLVDFTSMADLSTVPGHYVLFWEFASFGNTGQSRSPCIPEASVMEECCLAMESSFDTVYRHGRVREKFIGPLEIRVVSPGTFDALMDCCYAPGASMGQYKTPRYVNSEALIHLLNSRVSHSFFSPE
ncbi:hypothetical protein KP509_06G002900 [Ceratopteris richardii]|uniref:Uncharacterized protein n=1 Tax=Ceratopteris richardii TaxID=49495 RepID=A0A8T2UI29_CERRI|nr:hypothetical protein KP509_06G002900 [Ceratopteris richardii]